MVVASTEKQAIVRRSVLTDTGKACGWVHKMQLTWLQRFESGKELPDAVAQLVRALDCRSRGWEFESPQRR